VAHWGPSCLLAAAGEDTEEKAAVARVQHSPLGYPVRHWLRYGDVRARDLRREFELSCLLTHASLSISHVRYNRYSCCKPPKHSLFKHHLSSADRLRT
jgi:hypothetical protein